MYKLLTLKGMFENEQHIIRNDGNGSYTSFPAQEDNPNWVNLKKAISEETAQLQDAEGNLMTAQAAKDLIKELP
jgi:hypothetical protein